MSEQRMVRFRDEVSLVDAMGQKRSHSALSSRSLVGGKPATCLARREVLDREDASACSHTMRERSFRRELIDANFCDVDGDCARDRSAMRR